VQQAAAGTAADAAATQAETGAPVEERPVGEATAEVDEAAVGWEAEGWVEGPTEAMAATAARGVWAEPGAAVAVAE
jgi:hypothetical protein